MSPDPTLPHASAHQRHSSGETICNSSPFINRRVLDSHIEQELRQACRLILINFKPSDHGMDNTDPKLDFGGLRPRKQSQSHPAQVNVRVPTGAPAESPSTSFLPRSRSTKVRTRAKADMEIRARQNSDLPARANSSRKRADWLQHRGADKEERLRNFGKASMDVPRPAISTIQDEDVTLPVAVTSTLAKSILSSSVPASSSQHVDDPVAAADAQASEWMRLEFQRKRQQEMAERQRRPSASVRPPSRAASIKESVIEYVFPGSRSRALSRAQSKESLCSPPENESSLSRHGSTSTWRTWGLRRMKSSSSRPGASSGQADDSAQHKKSESNTVNLNRELPPLPSLDSWKDSQLPKQDVVTLPKSPKTPKTPKTPTAETHIASLMRSQDKPEDDSPASSRQHRRSGSDTLAMQYNSAFPVRKSSLKQGTQPIPQPASTVPTSPGQTQTSGTNGSSATKVEQPPDQASSSHARQRSGGSKGSDGSSHTSNFSRRLSVESPVTLKTVSHEPKPPAKEEQKSKLKKIFSGWIHKKDKKDHWMHKLEKEGVKEGVLAQDGNDGLASPVVRY